MLLVTEDQYFGSIDYCKTAIKFSHIVSDIYERWEKGLHLNQCHLLGPNGPLLLSVPLEAGRGQRTVLKDVKISYRQNWPLRHWRSIHDAYRKSPWFEHYADTLESLYNARPEYLMDWNGLTLDWVLGQLKWTGERSKTENFTFEYPEGLFADCRRKYREKPWKEGESGPPYRYSQVFDDRHGFVANLCVLDLILCEGPMARTILERII
jgi:hypothetical protein